MGLNLCLACYCTQCERLRKLLLCGTHGLDKGPSIMVGYCRNNKGCFESFIELPDDPTDLARAGDVEDCAKRRTWTLIPATVDACLFRPPTPNSYIPI